MILTNRWKTYTYCKYKPARGVWDFIVGNRQTELELADEIGVMVTVRRRSETREVSLTGSTWDMGQTQSRRDRSRVGGRDGSQLNKRQDEEYSLPVMKTLQYIAQNAGQNRAKYGVEQVLSLRCGCCHCILIRGVWPFNWDLILCNLELKVSCWRAMHVRVLFQINSSIC